MSRKNYAGIDLTGQKFGRLTVICKSQIGRLRWHCKCDCGNECDYTTSRLYNGQKSCGCLEKEMQKSFVKRHTTHGGSYTKLYHTWRGMKYRCENPKCANYKRYGAKGIKVCDEWSRSFSSFQTWALENGYIENADRKFQSLDRIDGKKGYNPENCKWSTAKEQVDNREITTFYNYNGKKITASEFASKNGIYDKSFVYKRLKAGMDLEKILIEWNIKHNTPNNLQKLSDYAKEHNISTVCALKWIKSGKVEGVRAGKYWYIMKGVNHE